MAQRNLAWELPVAFQAQAAADNQIQPRNSFELKMVIWHPKAKATQQFIVSPIY
jgi:hypothetical protein